MIAQTQAEFLKIRSTRTTIGLVLGMVALLAVITVLSGLLSHADQITLPNDQLNLLGLGGIAGIFASLAGILVVTSENRFGTIRPTFLFTPRWTRIMGSKVIASMLAGVVFGVVGEGITFAIGYACLSARGIDLSPSGGDIALLLSGTIVGTALWGGIGVGIGLLIRNQIGAVIGLLAWNLVLGNILFGLVPAVGRFTPVEAENSLTGATRRHDLPALAGGLTLLAWMVLLVAIGLAWTARRDVD